MPLLSMPRVLLQVSQSTSTATRSTTRTRSNVPLRLHIKTVFRVWPNVEQKAHHINNSVECGLVARSNRLLMFLFHRLIKLWRKVDVYRKKFHCGNSFSIGSVLNTSNDRLVESDQGCFTFSHIGTKKRSGARLRSLFKSRVPFVGDTKETCARFVLPNLKKIEKMCL